jgi:uncharacterized protein (DUF1684 family)
MGKPVLLLIVLFSPFGALTGQQAALEYGEWVEQRREAHRQGLLHRPNLPVDSAIVANLRYFEVDAGYRVAASVELTPEARPFEMATYAGVTQTYIQYAWATFQLHGQTCSLALYRNVANLRMPMYRDKLFLPFKDSTNGEDTYGGGRYLDLDIQQIENRRLTIDFNLAYNPLCAYADGYRCPIPPPENHLTIPIRAGERYE